MLFGQLAHSTLNSGLSVTELFKPPTPADRLVFPRSSGALRSRPRRQQSSAKRRESSTQTLWSFGSNSASTVSMEDMLALISVTLPVVSSTRHEMRLATPSKSSKTMLGDTTFCASWRQKTELTDESTTSASDGGVPEVAKCLLKSPCRLPPETDAATHLLLGCVPHVRLSLLPKQESPTLPGTTDAQQNDGDIEADGRPLLAHLHGAMDLLAQDPS